MLIINNLDHFYKESHTLWDIDFKIDKGSCMCLMGRNGVGKTTLLKCIMGLESIANGKIYINGNEYSSKTAEQRARNKIGYVPQGRDIFSQLTVEENLLTGLQARKDKAKTLPPLIFELFPVLKEMLNRRGGDLSGGQQQQLAIGRALALEPELLILDEPTEGIQPNVVSEIGDIINRLNKQLCLTVLLVEQKLPFAKKVASDFSIMERGEMVATGNINELRDDLIDRYLKV
jgi:urea transport system ATP-binding protein